MLGVSKCLTRAARRRTHSARSVRGASDRADAHRTQTHAGLGVGHAVWGTKGLGSFARDAGQVRSLLFRTGHWPGKLDQPTIHEFRPDSLDAFVGRFLGGVDHDLRVHGRLVWVGNAGKVLDLSRQSPLVEPLDVPLNQDIQRAVHEDLEEVRDAVVEFIPHRAVRGDGRRDGNHSIARKQFTDKADAPDVGVTVLFAESQAFRQVGPDHVAIQQFDLGACRAETPVEDLRKGAFAGPGEARKPDCETLMHKESGYVRRV